MKKLCNWLKWVLLLSALALPCAALAATTIDFSDTTGFGLNANEVQINNIRLDVEAVNPLDPSRPVIASAYYNVPFTFDPVTYHLVPSLGAARPDDTTTACASATIYVTNAYSGQVLANAAVAIGSTTVFTDATGQAVFSNLTEGAAIVEASAANYESGSRSATLSCATATSLGLSLSPTTGDGAVAASDVRITLAWGENPRDLDSHLTGPSDGNNGTAADTNRFHVYFSNRTGDVATLDVDDTSGYGPETITVVPPTGATILRPGIYRYTVHHYAGTETIATSGASVTLNLGGSQSREFLPPSDTTGLAGTSNDTWTVFELMVSDEGGITVLPVDTPYGSGTAYGSVRSTTTGYGAVETGVDFLRLHK